MTDSLACGIIEGFECLLDEVNFIPLRVCLFHDVVEVGSLIERIMSEHRWRDSIA